MRTSPSRSSFNTPAEDAEDFSGNAVIKARHACRKTGLAAIAEDSGLEVDSLDGKPGVRSARYAGEDASDADNLALLLERIGSIPEDRLAARFRCAVAYMEPGGCKAGSRLLITEAAWEGCLVKSPKGKGGFGYDPVFFVAEYGCTAAELSPETKNRISHRAQAFGKLRDRLAGRPG